MARYLALVNTPGYMPWDDDPPIFDTPGEAWGYLAEHRAGAYGMDGVPEHDEGIRDLGAQEAAGEHASTGCVYAPTPGYEGDHDLGLAYSVVAVEQRLATPEEAAAYLAGHAEFPGAEETEEGLLLPV